MTFLAPTEFEVLECVLSFLLGFLTWRLVELVQLTGDRLRVKRRRGELALVVKDLERQIRMTRDLNWLARGLEPGDERVDVAMHHAAEHLARDWYAELVQEEAAARDPERDAAPWPTSTDDRQP